jgi:hypothetical protein
MLRFAFLLLAGWTAAAALSAQPAPPTDSFLRRSVPLQSFDRQAWSRLTEPLDYPLEEEPDAGGPDFSLPGFRLDWLGPFVRAVAVGTLVVLLVFLVFRITDHAYIFRPGNKKTKPAFGIVKLAAIEADLPDADLEKPLALALDSGDYTLAVRLHYLSILQVLARNGWINWKKEKTNGEYLRELPPADWAPAVAAATRSFEQVWYGEMRLSADRYRSLESTFRQVHRQLTGKQTGHADAPRPERPPEPAGAGAQEISTDRHAD